MFNGFHTLGLDDVPFKSLPPKMEHMKDYTDNWL